MGMIVVVAEEARERTPAGAAHADGEQDRRDHRERRGQADDDYRTSTRHETHASSVRTERYWITSNFCASDQTSSSR